MQKTIKRRYQISESTKKEEDSKSTKSIIIIKENLKAQSNGESICRINYLFQAAHKIFPIDAYLARKYIAELKNIARRNVIRLYGSNYVNIYIYIFFFPLGIQA